MLKTFNLRSRELNVRNFRIMKNHKVKYTRQEYRQEYLKSDEWKSLRSTIMNSKPDCQCCFKEACDVHHMVYRNFVDTKILDLLPVCRSCHNLIHLAIDSGYISQKPEEVELIKEKTVGIINDQEFKEWRKWLKSKHFLSENEIQQISTLQSFVIKKISSLIRKNIWYNNLSEIKFTGHQILKIRKIIEMALYRRKNKIDVQKKGLGFGKKFGIVQPNSNHYSRKFTNSIKRR